MRVLVGFKTRGALVVELVFEKINLGGTFLGMGSRQPGGETTSAVLPVSPFQIIHLLVSFSNVTFAQHFQCPAQEPPMKV